MGAVRDKETSRNQGCKEGSTRDTPKATSFSSWQAAFDFVSGCRSAYVRRARHFHSGAIEFFRFACLTPIVKKRVFHRLRKGEVCRFRASAGLLSATGAQGTSLALSDAANRCFAIFDVKLEALKSEGRGGDAVRVRGEVRLPRRALPQLGNI